MGFGLQKIGFVWVCFGFALGLRHFCSIFRDFNHEAHEGHEIEPRMDTNFTQILSPKLYPPSHKAVAGQES